jgi:hypothetical protein
VKPCTVPDHYQYFGKTCCFHLHGRRVTQACQEVVQIQGDGGQDLSNKQANMRITISIFVPKLVFIALAPVIPFLYPYYSLSCIPFFYPVKAAGFSGILISIYRTTQCYILEDCNPDSFMRLELKNW